MLQAAAAPANTAAAGRTKNNNMHVKKKTGSIALPVSFCATSMSCFHKLGHLAVLNGLVSSAKWPSFFKKIDDSRQIFWRFRNCLINRCLRKREFCSEQTWILVRVNCEFTPGKLPF